MTPFSASAATVVADVAGRVDAVLEAFLGERRAEALALAPEAATPLDEIVRLLHAGGKRIRPAFCYWGYRAAGGADGEPILQAAAALELLHTMALIHDDVIDGDVERRGSPAVHVHAAAQFASRGRPEANRAGVGVAIVTGDLAAALAEQLFDTAGLPADRQAAGAARLQRMRAALAAGAYLGLSGTSAAPAEVAYLRGGAYTVEWPLLIGAALAGSDAAVDEALVRYARPLGGAFQLLDDLADGDAPAGADRADALAMVAAAAGAVASPPLTSAGADALRQMADLVGTL